MTPRNLMRKTWPAMLLMILLMSTTMVAPAFTTQPHATLSALQQEGSIRALLYAEGLPDAPVTITLTDETGRLYILPGTPVDEHIWEAAFPITPDSAHLTAWQDTTIIASVSRGTPPSAARAVITKATIADSRGRERAARIDIGRESVPTDLLLELPRGRYALTITPEEAPIERIVFTDLLVEGSIDLGVEELHDGRFLQAYAIDPTRLDFTNATVTVTAKGTTLHKCAEWNFTTQTCYGSWDVHKTGLVPGEEYTFTLSALDPAFGETDAESEPDSCTFSDDAGEGDGDTNVNCLTEVATENSGYNADMDDLETTGTGNQATMDLAFLNNLFVESINSVNVTFRYQRQTNSQVGPTTATIQVFDSGAYTTACTDTITIGSWETYSCDLSTWVTTEAELNSVSIKLIIDTAASGQPKQAGRTFVDHIYLSADYVERDVTAPQYGTITTQPSSPTSYTRTPSWFNVTWTDDFNISDVVIEHNFTGTGLVNTSMSNLSSEYYYTTTLPAGSYVWRSYANDTTNNVNRTPQYMYVVSKATPLLTLTFNGTADNITVNDSATINITGTNGEGIVELLRETSTIASGTSPVSTLELFNAVGVHNITLRHNETQNYTYGELTRTVTVVDTIPPGPVTGLDNTSRGTSWLYWTWSLPGDSDFDHVEIWLNGTFKTNSTGTIYNATALNADTLYEIQIRSVDIHGVKSSYATDTGKTDITTDTTPPIISNLQHTGITASGVNITWDTDELAGCLVRWGTSSGTYTKNVSCTENKLSQEILLTTLQPSTTYYYRVTATDIADNSANSPERSFATLADTTPPQYGTITVAPTGPVTYTGGTHWFNVTWTDDVMIGSAVIEHNFTGSLQNYSTSNISDEYYYSTTMNAGSYVWRSYASDGSNTNRTPQYTYVVSKATPTIALYLDGVEGDNTINEDATAKLNGTMITPATGYLYLYYDGGLVDQGNDHVEYAKTFDIPTTHNVTLAYAGSTNYEATSTTYWLTVQDTVAPEVTLTGPAPAHNDSDGIVVFTYDVDEDGALANCSLLINGSIEQTNSSVTAGSNSFTKTDFDDGLYDWNVQCYDTADNTGSGTARSLIIDKQTITIDVPATSTSAWDDADAISIAAINATGGTTESRTIAKGTFRYITWTNYTTAGIPPGATIVDADFNVRHSGSTRTTFEGIDWYDGGSYLGTGCTPVLQTGAFRTDTCDLSSYIDTVDEANEVSLRYKVSAANLGSGGSITLDYLYMTLVYIKETTAPTITSIYNVTVDLGDSVAAQFNATDNYGVGNWTVNGTAFSISATGLLTNATALTEGVYKLSVRAIDPSDNYDEENITVTVTDIVDVNIGVDTTGLGTTLHIYNSSGGLVSSGGATLTDSVLANQLYDLVFTTTLTSGALSTTLYDVNLTQDVNFTSDITETYAGALPTYISSVSPIYALDDQDMNFAYAELSIPKAGLDIEYIIHCTDWNATADDCAAWEVNETADYSYTENATHYRINVTGFDAFGGGPGDTLANLTEIRLYDVTGLGSNRTGGTLVNNGTNTTFRIGTDRLYRAEFHVTNAGKKWIIVGSDVATHAGLNSSWTIAASDIWYGILGTNYTGGTFASSTVTWDLSGGGTIDQGDSGTWYYVFNTTSLPAKDYPVLFTINDTNKASGSMDTSTYEHVYERELVVNGSSLGFSTETPIEGENVTITMTVYNIGLENATDFNLELWDLTLNVLLNNVTINVSAESSTQVQYNWTAQTGQHLMELKADTLGVITEAFEDNNNYSSYLNTSAWHVFYGSVFQQTVLEGGTTTFHAWPQTDVTTANIYAADSDATIRWNGLQALTRDMSNNSASEDLGETDLALGMTGYPDSVTARYGTDNSTPTTTDSFIVYGRTINSVPVVDSTTTSSFQTGILWDSSDDTGDGEYDGTEALVFLTKTSADTLGTYGTYDYELTIPSSLQETEGAGGTTYFYVEIT